MAYIPTLKKKYQEEIIPALKKETACSLNRHLNKEFVI